MKKLSCQEVENNLIFFIEENLDEEKMLDFESHINTCANCNALFKKLKADLLLIENDKISKVNQFFYKRLDERLLKEESKKLAVIRLKTREVYIKTASYAAGIVLAIFLGIGIGADFNDNSEIIVEDFEELNDYQIFADSYNLNPPSEDAYDLETSLSSNSSTHEHD